MLILASLLTSLSWAPAQTVQASDFLEEDQAESDEYDVNNENEISQSSEGDFDRDFRPLPLPDLKPAAAPARSQAKRIPSSAPVSASRKSSSIQANDPSDLPFQAKPKEPPHYELRLSIKDLLVSDGLSKKEVVKYILTRVDKLQTCFPRAIPLEKIDQPVKIQVKATEYDAVRSVSIKSSIPRSAQIAQCVRTSLKSAGAKFSSDTAGKYDFELNLAR